MIDLLKPMLSYFLVNTSGYQTQFAHTDKNDLSLKNSIQNINKISIQNRMDIEVLKKHVSNQFTKHCFLQKIAQFYCVRS